MKLLLDTCMSKHAKTALQAKGHDVVWMGDATCDPGDAEILADAVQQGRVLVTLDKDFGEMAIVQGVRHSGIIRLANFPAKQQADVCEKVLEKHGDDLLRGAIVTAEPGRLRIHPPPE